MLAIRKSLMDVHTYYVNMSMPEYTILIYLIFFVHIATVVLSLFSH